MIKIYVNIDINQIYSNEKHFLLWLTDQLLFKTRFPKSGTTYGRPHFRWWCQHSGETDGLKFSKFCNGRRALSVLILPSTCVRVLSLDDGWCFFNSFKMQYITKWIVIFVINTFWGSRWLCWLGFTLLIFSYNWMWNLTSLSIMIRHLGSHMALSWNSYLEWRSSVPKHWRLAWHRDWKQIDLKT